MSVDPQDRYTLCQVSPDDWVIADALIADSTHRLVACVSEHDGFVEVRWFRNFALPHRFPTRFDALESLRTATLAPTPL